MGTFFTYGTELPEGSGYGLLSMTHIMIMLSCFVLISAILFLFRISVNSRDRISRIVAVIPVILIILRAIYAAVYKAPLLYELPLHLCSLTGFMCLAYDLSASKNGFFLSVLGHTLYSLCLPGAFLALVFPDATFYPAFHFITIESFLFHALIIAYIVLKLMDGSIVPDIRDAYKTIIFLMIIVPPMMLFDHHFGVNYMYLTGPSSGSPLSGFYTAGGYPGYLIGYGIVAVCVICAMEFTGMITASFPCLRKT